MFVETPLIFKTLVILSVQLGIVLMMCFYCLNRAKKAYENNTTFMGLLFRGSVNMKGKLDLIPYLETKKDFPKPMEKHEDKDTVLHEVAKNQDEVIELLKMGYIHSRWAVLGALDCCSGYGWGVYLQQHLYLPLILLIFGLE